MQATVKLYSAEGSLVADLVNASNVTWQDVFNDIGTGQFSLPYDDPQAVQIVPGTQVYCYLDGLHVFTWVVEEPPGITAVDESEESGQEYQVSGQGKTNRLAHGRVYPWRGLNPQVMTQHRIYSFASPDYPNLADWVPAYVVAPQSYIDPIRQAIIEYTTVSSITDIDDVVELVPAAAPLGWPGGEPTTDPPLVPEANWIWGQSDVYPVGFNYFRSEFTLPGETKLVIAATADNYWTLYLDGTPILGDQGEGNGWNEHKRIDLTLVAGTYNLAAVVENIPQEGLPDIYNPAAFLCAVYTADADGKVLTTIKVSDDSWIALPYPAIVPGWTPGQIMLDAITEVQARGGLLGFECAFDGEDDSGGNPWVGSSGPGSFVPGYSTPIGSTVLDILNDLVSQGWIDYRFDATTDKLRMWSKGTGSEVLGIDFVVDGDVDTQNVVSIEHEPHHTVTTTLFVKWSKGFMEVNNATAMALYGRVEGFLTVDTDVEAEALRQAQLALDEIDNIEYAIVAHVDPIRPLVDEPYQNFVPGDFVNITAVVTPADIAAGVNPLKSVKVWSISVAANEMGVATLVLELNNRLRSPDRDLFDITTALGRGVVGSTKYRNKPTSTTNTTGGG